MEGNTAKNYHMLVIPLSTDPAPVCCGMIWTPPYPTRPDSGIIWTPPSPWSATCGDMWRHVLAGGGVRRRVVLGGMMHCPIRECI